MQDDMRAKLGDLESRLGVYSLAEVSQRNAAGACWLILDGAHARQSSASLIAPHVPHMADPVQGGARRQRSAARHSAATGKASAIRRD